MVPRLVGSVPHNTPEQIATALGTAQGIADRAELSAEERVTCLPALLTLLCGRQLFFEQPQAVNLGAGRLAIPASR